MLQECVDGKRTTHISYIQARPGGLGQDPLGVGAGLFLLWMLNSIDSSILPTWDLLEEKEIALDSKDGKLELAVGDVDGLPANAGKLDVEVISSGSNKGERSRLTKEEVKEQIEAGKKVILVNNVMVSHLLTPEDIRRIIT